MKKLIIGIVSVLSVMSICLLAVDGVTRYCYKAGTDGKLNLKVVTADADVSRLQGKGYSVAPSKQAMWQIMGEEFEKRVPVSSREKFMWSRTLSKLAAIRALSQMYAAGVGYQDEILLGFFATDPKAKLQWDAATEVNLDDPVLKVMLPALGIDPDAVKEKILELGIQ